MLGSSLHGPPPPPPEPTTPPEQLPKGYQWPASRITKGDMIKLTELRSKLRKPITMLIHESIDAYYRSVTTEQSAPADVE